MDQPDPNLSDDDFRMIVRRCWLADACPSDVRDRLVAQVRRAGSMRRAWLYGLAGSALAAAACIALVFGIGLIGRRASPQPEIAAAVLPAAVESALIQTHDQCSRGGDHQRLPVPLGNGYAISASLRSTLDRPVLVSRPADARWRFAGASVCPVGAVRSAHLVFRRADGDALSVFSLPRSVAAAAADGTQFQGDADGHPIVGFVGHSAVYCLVGSGCPADVSVTRLAEIRRQLEGQTIVADAISAPGFSPGAELIHAAAVGR